MKKPFKNPFRHHRAKNRNKPRGYSPTQIICVSFVIVIALGTLLLSLPIASRYGRMRVIDAMFTATSATCVTGLVVRDTWTQFTVFGQAVILVLIQVGGLGLVTLTSFFALAMRRRMGFRDLRVLGESVEGKTVFIADDIIASGESMLEVASNLKERGAANIIANATFPLFTSGLDKFDKAVADGTLTYVVGTNLTYRMPELLTRDWYVDVDVSKYAAYFVVALNHDMSVSSIIDPLKKIENLLANRK